MASKHVRWAAALLATTALGLGALEIEANLAARGAVDALLARHPGLTVGGVLAEPLTGRVTLTNIGLARGDTRVTIGALDLPLSGSGFGFVRPAAASPFEDKDSGAAAPAPAPKAETPAPTPAPAPAPTASGGPGTATATNVTLTHGRFTYRAKQIQLTGTSLSDADLTALLDVNSATPVVDRLKKLDAKTITIPGLNLDDATPGSERHIAIAGIQLDDVKAGKASSATTKTTVLSIEDGKTKTTGTIDGSTAKGIDLVQLARIATVVRSNEAEPLLPVYDEVEANGVRVTNETSHADFTIASVKEAGLSGRPLKTDFITQSRNGTDLPKDEQNAIFDDLMHSIAVKSMEATDIVGHGANGDNFTLASASMQDLANRRLGGLSMKVFNYNGKTVKVDLGSVEVGPFVLPTQGGLAAATQPSVPSTGKVDVNRLHVNVETEEKTDKTPPKNVDVKVAHIGFIGAGDPGDLPKSTRSTIDNVVFDIPPGNEQMKTLTDMGYEHLDVSLALATSYEPEQQSLKVQDLTLSGVDMGSAALGLHLVNVTKGIVSPNKEIAKASALAVLAKGITLDLVNKGLIDKLVAWKAKQDGVDVAEEKKTIVDFFANTLPASVNGNANAKLIGGAIAKFVAEPKTLHIDIQSKSGLGVGSMGLLSDPGVLLDTLDVKASANQ